MERTTRSPDEFIASLPDGTREEMQTLDGVISKHLKGLPRVMWEGVFWGGSEQKIIGYGTMSYTRSDKKTGEWFLVGLGLQKNYISVYVAVVHDKKYLVETHKDELGKVKTGKSIISIKRLEDLNMPGFEKLLRRVMQLQ